MADKEYVIKVTTEADASDVDSLKTKLEETKSAGEDAGAELQKAFEEATEEVERLQDALDEAHINGDDIEADIIADQLADAEQEAERLADALSNIDASGLNDAVTSSDELDDSLQKASGSADDLNNSLGVLESSALMDMSSQVGQLGSNAEGMAQGINTASISVGQLATNCGIAEPQMVNLISHISNATFPQNEAMAYVNTLNQMGVSADHLGDSATDMDRMNDAFGIGYEKTIQLTQGLRSVGISADNLPASYNALAYAQSNVAGGVDTYTMALQRQGKTLNEYGINADQLAVILAKLSERGLSQRQINQVLGQSLKDCNGDVTALEQSLGLETGTLSNASTVTAQYQGQVQNLANEEMEHKTVLDQLGAVWEDLSLQMSGVLGPLTSIMGIIGQVGQWALGINSIITLVNTMREWEAVTWLTSKAQAVLNLVMSMNPIILVVMAIILLVGYLIYLYYTNENVRQAIDNFGQTLYNVGQIIYSWIVNAIQQFIQFFVTLNTRIVQFQAQLTSTIINTAINMVNGFISYVSQLPSKFAQELQNMINKAIDFANRLPQILWDAGRVAVSNFLGALGIASPGTMQIKLLKEFEDTGDKIPSSAQKILRNVSLLGDDIVDAFGTPRLSNVALGNTSNGTGSNSVGFNPTINIEIGSVDNDERINEIVEAVTKALKWNNITAGRTV